MRERGENTGQTAVPEMRETQTQIQKITFQSRDSRAKTTRGTSAGVEKPEL